MHITGLHIEIGLQGPIIHASRAKQHLSKTDSLSLYLARSLSHSLSFSANLNIAAAKRAHSPAKTNEPNKWTVIHVNAFIHARTA